MQVHIGPIAGVFSGRLVVSDEVAPESCTLTVEGKGKPGSSMARVMCVWLAG